MYSVQDSYVPGNEQRATCKRRCNLDNCTKLAALKYDVF